MDLKGSGFYSYRTTGFTFECSECGHENIKVDGYVDDWGSHYGQCEKCNEYTEIEMLEE